MELSELSEKARTRKIALEEMQGGCFSISNLGGIGGSFFTPIVNAPEVAILGISRARMEPVFNKETSSFAPRLMLPLSLSYDHRVIDGADGDPLPAVGRRGARAAVPAGVAGVTRAGGRQDRQKASRPTVRPPANFHDIQLVVVGGGPGGYAAAFLAADLGLTVALIDPEPNPGGVCVYRGCIPSKALLHVAKVVTEARHASAWGVQFGEPTIDLGKLREFKNNVVKRLTSGTGQLVKHRKVQYIQGHAELVGPHSLRVRRTGDPASARPRRSSSSTRFWRPVRFPPSLRPSSSTIRA